MSRLREQFGKTAAAYVASATHAAGADLDRLVAVAAPLAHERAIDVGCGVGHTLRRVAEHVAFAVGADATMEMMRAGRGSVVTAANVAFAQADASSLPFADGAFDIATCRHAAHHFVDADAAFREVARVLRRRGRLVLVDSCAPDDPALDAFINELEVLRDASHVRDHTVGGWAALLEAAGLRPSVESEGLATVLVTEEWLARSQTPPDAAAEVRRRLRDAPPAAREAFRITATTFALPKIVLLARR